ncbi:CGNR zinc finger domain-containing protein [Saccharopolyspora sp. 5N708]|uniref:CGNR zinc finger domain-containing protein n=1 Tax=Saccharopolyspora sp. 5N708 TaxID=3457424 RepID=UPI003FD47130
MTARSPLEPSSTVQLVLDFVNTHPDGTGRTELFSDGEALSSWLGTVGLTPNDTLVTDADAAAARELRDALVTILLAHSDDDPAMAPAVQAAQQYLHEIADRYPLVPIITADQIRLISAQTGVPRALGTVLAAVTEFARSGDWARIKACRNPPCHFAFFDRSRNGSAGFCSPGCRSQASMRAYRARHKT